MAFAGYPAGVYYPVLGDLLITVTRWLTFGLLSFERAYGLFILILVVIIPLVVYMVTRRLTGRFGALIAGVLIAGTWEAGPRAGTSQPFTGRCGPSSWGCSCR